VSLDTLSPRDRNAGARAAMWPRWLRIGFWLCTAIAVAAVIRRIFALLYLPRSGPPQLLALDALFASHAALTLSHIVPALTFVLLAPLVFMRRFAGSYSVGGWVERSAVLVFNTLFLYSLGRAFWHWRRGESARKLRWLTLAFGILLGIATTRPVMGLFFATSRLTHLEPRQFFGIAFWIGFSANTVATELWLRSPAGRSQIHAMAASSNP